MPAAVTETRHQLALSSGPLDYTLRRTPRARTLRVTIHPERGVVVSVPPASRRGWAHAEAYVERFLTDRERWIRRHVARHRMERRARARRPDLGDGRPVTYLGVEHLVRFVGEDRATRSRVRRVASAAGDELVVEVSPRDRRRPADVLEHWLRERAREAIDEAIGRHVEALGRSPAAVTLRDPRSRWGSCSRAGRISLSWRLVLAPPEALESVVVHELCHLKVFGHGPRFRALLASRIPRHAEWRRWLNDHWSELHAALNAGAEAPAAA